MHHARTRFKFIILLFNLKSFNYLVYRDSKTVGPLELPQPVHRLLVDPG